MKVSFPRLPVVSIVLATACTHVESSPAVSTPAPRPVITLTEASMFGGLTPYWFVLYEDGSVVVRREAGGVERFDSVTLTPPERDGLAEEIGRDLQGLPAVTDTEPQVTDLPIWDIKVEASPRRASVRVRASAIPEVGVPPAFVAPYQRLFGFSHPNERPWVPTHLELYADSVRKTAGCPWPARWQDRGPQLSPYVSQGGPRLYEVRGEWLVDIQEFLKRCRAQTGETTVSMDGETVVVHLRVRMPHERD